MFLQRKRLIIGQSFLIFLVVVNCRYACAQTISDSILIQKTIPDSSKIDSNTLKENNVYRFSPKKLIIPGALVGYGILGLTFPPLKTLNHSTANEIAEDKPRGTNLDNYTQYLPAVMVYGLNAAGIKGKHNIADRTIILATSQLIAAGIDLPLKHLVHEERPDHSNYYSFPSGHTTTAFATATFMYEEYKSQNFWLSIAGFPIAAFTGIYRVVNNKHWVGDVVAGAGFGILSTEMAYWSFPLIRKLFYKHSIAKQSVLFYPNIQPNSYGIGLVKRF